MCPNLQIPEDLVKFTEESLDGKLHALCSEEYLQSLNLSKAIQ